MTQLEQRVLDWINRMRRANNLGRALKRIPRGHKGSCSRCPIAQALTPPKDGRWRYVEVDGGYVAWGGGVEPPKEIEPPKYITEFVTRFDAGRFPQYLQGGDK